MSAGAAGVVRLVPAPRRPGPRAARGGPLALPGLRDRAAVEARLAQLAETLAQLEGEGRALARRWRSRWPDAPVYLARYADRTLTPWRWRRSSARGHRVRHGGRQAINPPVEPLGPQGLALLEAMAPALREAWLEAEAERQAINAAAATLAYERERLVRLLDARARIAALACARMPQPEGPGFRIAEAGASASNVPRGTSHPRRSVPSGGKEVNR
ncbi:MAG TPA: hypothetical protein ENK20_11400 [Chromatiales bacterium]|nr:hypothetical protein [Chromatiales bacterium]